MNNKLRTKIVIPMVAIALIVGASHSLPAKADSMLGASVVVTASILAPHALNSAAKIPEAGSKFVVASVSAAGDLTTTVLKEMATGAKFILQTPSKVVGKTLVVAGDIVTISTNASGKVLTHAGEAIAFLPNEAGKSLIHHSEH